MSPILFFTRCPAEAGRLSILFQLYVLFLFFLRAFRHLLGKFFPLLFLLLFLLFHLLASLLAEFGIGDTGVVDRLQAPDEHVLGCLQVAEGDGAVVEEALAHLCLDDTIDQGADALGRILLERSRSRLYRVADHQDRLLTRERVRTRVAEQALIDLLVGMLVGIFDVEVARQSRAVVRGDEVADDLWQVVLLGQAQSLRDVADDDGCALRVRQFVVRVEARLVLREIDRVLHLSDVMVERPRTHQLRLGPNLVGYLRSQVAHGDGVLECARRLLAQFAKQRVVCIGKLEERHRRGESEGLLDHQHQGIGEEEEETIDREVVVDGAVELRDIIRLDELEREIDQRRGSRDEERREEYLTPSRQFAERVDCHEARHQLYGDKLILVFHGHSTNEDGRDVLDEGRSRVHEDAPEDGRDGKRDDIDAEERVLHHEGRQEREEDDQGVEHGYGSRLREVVLAEERQIEGEERDEQQDVDSLSRYGRSQLVLRGALLRHGTLVGVEHEHHPRGDDVALGDDALPLEHHSACLRDEAEIVVELHFAPASVVAEVGRDEIVEVASL